MFSPQMINYNEFEAQVTEVAGNQYDMRQIEPSKMAQRIMEDEYSHLLSSGKSKKFVPVMS